MTKTIVRLATTTALVLAGIGATFTISLVSSEFTPAFAQASTANRGSVRGGGGPTGGGKDFSRNDDPLVPGRMPCGTGATSVHCPPPRRPPVQMVEAVEEECSCDRVYREINGRLMIVTECYSVHDSDISLPIDQCKPQRKVY